MVSHTSGSVRGRRRRFTLRIAVAFAAACAVTVTGLPGMPVTGAQADISGGKRCDKKWLGKEISGQGRIPGSGTHSELAPGLETTYDFANGNAAYDDLKAPTKEQLKRAGNTDAAVKKWDRQFKKSKNPADKAMAIYARYYRQLISGNSPTHDWNQWLNVKYIGNQAVNARGRAFEAKVVKDFNLVGPDWLCQVKVTVKDPKTGKRVVRDFDAYNRRTKEFAEFKSNGAHRADQHSAERIILRDPKYRDHRLTYVTGMKTEGGTRNAVKGLDDELKKERGTDRTQVRVREHRSTGRAQIGKPNVYTKYDKIMNPDPQKGGRGPVNSAARNSGPTPEDARRQQELARKAGTRGAFPGGRGPGGVDFSTLELRYVGNPEKGKGLDYSFKADYMKDPDRNPGYGGKAKLQLASDAFFTWLALTPDKFWVNLNPIRPDVIMDDEFAKTDAGRVLLEADLTLKHDAADVINPDKYERGERFWRSVPRTAEGAPCIPVFRQWITPEPAKVREQDGGIHILDAPLKVNLEVYRGPDAPPTRCKITEAQTLRAEALMKSTMVPALERRVNESASYADLRRVYTSRVAAEWVRQQDKSAATDFHKIIDSNDVKRWPLRGKNKDWNKKTVFDKYVKSFNEGDYTFEREYGGKVWVQSMGGVDFSKSPKRKISEARFSAEHPQLDKTTRTSVRDETAHRDTSTSYMGGNSAGDLGDDPEPSPTPTPPDEPEPSPTPTEGTDPTPSPSGGPTDKPSPTKPGGGPDATPNRPDGDLADTGNTAPVGLIAGLAAALAASGAALMWWRRRRNEQHG